MYGQFGEDLVIDTLLGFKPAGFYVDVGAHDPHRFSNTKRFYRRGWHGINIEPNVTCHAKFVRVRTRDINLNIGAGDCSATLTFHHFLPATLSTFSEEQARQYATEGYVLKGRSEIQVDPLSAILSTHVADGTKIDFFSIDTEGLDLAVLRGNDWERFRPYLVCVESAAHSADSPGTSDISELQPFMHSVGYAKAADTGLNSIYVDSP